MPQQWLKKYCTGKRFLLNNSLASQLTHYRAVQRIFAVSLFFSNNSTFVLQLPVERSVCDPRDQLFSLSRAKQLILDVVRKSEFFLVRNRIYIVRGQLVLKGLYGVEIYSKHSNSKSSSISVEVFQCTQTIYPQLNVIRPVLERLNKP